MTVEGPCVYCPADFPKTLCCPWEKSVGTQSLFSRQPKGGPWELQNSQMSGLARSMNNKLNKHLTAVWPWEFLTVSMGLSSKGPSPKQKDDRFLPSSTPVVSTALDTGRRCSSTFAQRLLYALPV
jgi:hypothetical protein